MVVHNNGRVLSHPLPSLLEEEFTSGQAEVQSVMLMLV